MDPLEPGAFGVKMEEHYKQIKAAYDDFYKFLLRKGKLPMWATEKGYWDAAISDDVFELFKQMKLHKFNSFVDLGSGDGKVVLIASLFGLKATGIEHDKWLHDSAVQFKQKLSHIPDTQNAEFIQQDFLEHDLSKYDVVFIHPDTPMHRGLQNKLLEELNGKLVVYGPHFHPSALEQEQRLDVGTVCGIYTKP
jgi:hypothetical protein